MVMEKNDNIILYDLWCGMDSRCPFSGREEMEPGRGTQRWAEEVGGM